MVSEFGYFGDEYDSKQSRWLPCQSISKSLKHTIVRQFHYGVETGGVNIAIDLIE
jgi:hypothetical protein